MSRNAASTDSDGLQGSQVDCKAMRVRITEKRAAIRPKGSLVQTAIIPKESERQLEVTVTDMQSNENGCDPTLVARLQISGFLVVQQNHSVGHAVAKIVELYFHTRTAKG